MTGEQAFSVIMSLLVIGPVLIGIAGLWIGRAIHHGNPSDESPARPNVIDLTRYRAGVRGALVDEVC